MGDRITVVAKSIFDNAEDRSDNDEYGHGVEHVEGLCPFWIDMIRPYRRLAVESPVEDDGAEKEEHK